MAPPGVGGPGVDLSQGDYMTPILAATEGLRVSLVFNNAGYIAPGFFVEEPLQRSVLRLGPGPGTQSLTLSPFGPTHACRSLRNYETNATCALKITHHFANLMLDRGDRGLIAFTSSSSAFLPNPMASIYASTKAFLTAFGTSIAAELRPLGIDVVVVHPSPIASRFLENAGGFSAALASAKVAAPPSVVADALFVAAGRFVIYDQVRAKRTRKENAGHGLFGMAGGDGRCEAYVHRITKADAAGEHLREGACTGVDHGGDEAGDRQVARLQLCGRGHVPLRLLLGRLEAVQRDATEAAALPIRAHRGSSRDKSFRRTPIRSAPWLAAHPLRH